MKEQDLMKDEYATKELHLASFLQVKGMLIKKLEQYGDSQGRRNPVYFIFADRKECERLESVFWNGVGDDVIGNLKEYSTTIGDLKTRVFSITQLVKREEASFSESMV